MIVCKDFSFKIIPKYGYMNRSADFIYKRLSQCTIYLLNLSTITESEWGNAQNAGKKISVKIYSDDFINACKP